MIHREIITFTFFDMTFVLVLVCFVTVSVIACLNWCPVAARCSWATRRATQIRCMP